MSGEIPVIVFEGDRQTLVWHHPTTDFVMGTQLIVHETQEAIFFRNGEALDSFGAGRYTLETGCLPKMEKLYKLPTFGQPFHSEVYFINLITLMNIKWGTNSKIGLFDPISGIHIELGASGAFNIRVNDARRLLLKLVGTAQGLSKEQLTDVENNYFRTLIVSKVKSNLARIIKENRINILEIDAQLDSLSAYLKDAINESLVEYGLVMPEFFVANVLTPEDDPNFRLLKQQHAQSYLLVKQEEILKAEAEAAMERKAVQAQTDARMRMINAQSEAEMMRVKAQAEADARRLKADAEAYEMQAKGFTYQQETLRQIGVEAMKSDGAAKAVGSMAGDMMGMGVGLGALASVAGAAKDTLAPIMGATADMVKPGLSHWACSCGQTGLTGNFCPHCGKRKVE